MATSVPPSSPVRLRSALPAALSLALVGAFGAAIPATAFSDAWTSPNRVFEDAGAPNHAMTTDSGGKVHIATERSTGGVFYVTNVSGSWQECQVSAGNDRRPSIDVDGGVVHIAFARLSGETGIYTASGEPPPGDASDCGWDITSRYAGAASHPSLVARSGSLSVAFRTGDNKLRFIKGPASPIEWTVRELIDGSCCTSPVVLALTHTGAARVAYGDGAGNADGLKYGVRTSKGWKKSKAHTGRVKQVAMVLDQTPEVITRVPSNAPHIAYVVKGQGTFVAAKSSSGTSGSWTKRTIARSFGPVALTHASNVTYIVYADDGDLRHARTSGGIWTGGALSNGGSDGKPQLVGGQLTFSRDSGTKGIFHTRAK
jgi:hypothetical protein